MCVSLSMATMSDGASGTSIDCGLKTERRAREVETIASHVTCAALSAKDIVHPNKAPLQRNGFPPVAFTGTTKESVSVASSQNVSCKPEIVQRPLRLAAIVRRCNSVTVTRSLLTRARVWGGGLPGGPDVHYPINLERLFLDDRRCASIKRTLLAGW